MQTKHHHSPQDSSPGGILEKLKAALRADGDFPVRAKVVADLRNLVNDPKAPIDKITECILREPSLGTRVLHVVNSSFYRRNSPVMTVSQAVVQLGMQALGDLCSGLVLMQRFIPAAKSGGIFAESIKKCILTSSITSVIVKEMKLGDQTEEKGYLVGTLYTLGPLLLAYYFPQLCETAERRAAQRGQRISQSLTELMGITPIALSVGIVDSLGIPPFYKNVMMEAHSLSAGNSKEIPVGLAGALAIAERVADSVVFSKNRAEFEQTVQKICNQTSFTPQQIMQLAQRVPALFKTHCKITEISSLTLPEWVDSLSADDTIELESKAAAGGGTEDNFSFYVEEIKQAIANGETLSSITTSVMETLAFGLSFDRVLLLFSDTYKTLLEGKMSLGQDFGRDPKEVRRKITGPQAEGSPDVQAFIEGVVQLYGDPIFEDGWPFVAIPIGSTDRTIGVIYADRIAKDGEENEALDSGVQVAVNLLAEMLDEAITANS